LHKKSLQEKDSSNPPTRLLEGGVHCTMLLHVGWVHHECSFSWNSFQNHKLEFSSDSI